MNQFSIIQTLLLRKGAEELILTKRTHPDEAGFYALSLAMDAKQGTYISIPTSLRRVNEIRTGHLTLRAAFAQPETAFWFRCKIKGDALEGGDKEPNALPAEYLPDDVTLDVAAGRAPARVPASERVAERILRNVTPAVQGSKRAAARSLDLPVGVTVPRPRKIESAVLAVLSQATCEGNLLRLNGQLDRELYVAVNTVLDAAGGKWKGGKTKAHVFEDDAEEIIEPILLTGEIALKADFGFFPTPRHVVERFVLPRLILKPESHALEPEAGDGGIALPLARICRVDCVELQEKNVKILQQASVFERVLQADFLSLDPRDFPQYDAVVMNPPFAKQADIKHALHAARFVKPGGQLVSILSAGVTYRSDKLTKQFTEFVASQGGEISRLPEGSFKESGTDFNTVIASMRIDGPELAHAIGSDLAP